MRFWVTTACFLAQARCSELLAGRDKARRQLDACKAAWAMERTSLKTAAASLQAC